MTTDDLQRLSSILRWVGLGTTALGVFITVASHLVADRLIVVQRGDKAKTQQRLEQSDAQLRAAKDEAARALQAAAALEEKQAPRLLSDAGTANFMAALRPFPNQLFTAVISPTGNDVRPLWVQLDRVLRTAGWQRVPPPGLAVGDPPAGVLVAPMPGVGVALDKSAYESVGPAANALVKALSDAGIETTLHFSMDPKETRLGVVTIDIGPKP